MIRTALVLLFAAFVQAVTLRPDGSIEAKMDLYAADSSRLVGDLFIRHTGPGMDDLLVEARIPRYKSEDAYVAAVVYNLKDVTTACKTTGPAVSIRNKGRKDAAVPLVFFIKEISSIPKRYFFVQTSHLSLRADCESNVVNRVVVLYFVKSNDPSQLTAFLQQQSKQSPLACGMINPYNQYNDPFLDIMKP